MVGLHAHQQDNDARAALGPQARWLNRLSAPGTPDLPTITSLDELSAVQPCRAGGDQP